MTVAALILWHRGPYRRCTQPAARSVRGQGTVTCCRVPCQPSRAALRGHAGRLGRPEEGRRHRGAQRIGTAAVVEVARVAAGFVGSGVAGRGLRPRAGILFHRFTTHPTASAVATMGSAPGMGQISAASNRGSILPSFIASPHRDRTRPTAAFRRLGSCATPVLGTS
jgi:hypothetical protein